MAFATHMTCRSARFALAQPLINSSKAVSNASKQATSLKTSLLTPFTPRAQAVFGRRQQLDVRAMASQVKQSDNPKFDVFCKGAPEGGNPSDKGTLLDCPFSQWVMLTLEEKGVPYRKQLCDESDLPKFLGDVHPAGKPLIPVVKDLEADKYIGESTDIIKYIEEKFPDPKLGTPDSTTDVGEDFFPDKFLEFLKSDGGSSAEGEAEAELRDSLKTIDDALGKSDGPFLSGQNPCAQCLALAPRLYHASVALPAIKNWPIPEEYSNVHKFLQAIKSRPSWDNCKPVNDQAVVDGWKTKLKSIKEQEKEEQKKESPASG